MRAVPGARSLMSNAQPKPIYVGTVMLTRHTARGAEPLAGNCCLVAGQRLSPSVGYRQPANIRVPRYRFCGTPAFDVNASAP
jgi:hypothetical protein